jgi:DNA-binding LacI/PurR family transcriptional regulator
MASPKEVLTIRDVAIKTGVSVATVSRTLNRPSVVHPDTRLKVLQAIEELQYVPNSFAKSLATQRSGLIGLVIPEITNPFFSVVAHGCEDAVRDHQYGLVLCNIGVQGSEETGIYRLLRNRQVDGIILVSPPLLNGQLPAIMQGTSAVHVDYDPNIPGADVVGFDNAAGGRMAAEHFILNGHKHMAVVLGFASSYGGATARLNGFREALREHALTLPEANIVTKDFELAEGVSVVRNLMALNPAPTAIFASNDLLAMRLLRSLLVLGYRVPEDVAIAGFGDLALCQLSTPSLTSIVVDKYELGRKAAELLVTRIESPTLRKRRLVLPVHLAVRESSVIRK